MPALDAAAAADEALSTVFRFATYSVAALLFGFALFAQLYVLAQLDDLQADFVNPHDASRRINRLVDYEIGAWVAASALMLCGGHYAWCGSPSECASCDRRAGAAERFLISR